MLQKITRVVTFVSMNRLFFHSLIKWLVVGFARSSRELLQRIIFLHALPLLGQQLFGRSSHEFL